jgi:N-acetylneuraminic acid mutarotase
VLLLTLVGCHSGGRQAAKGTATTLDPNGGTATGAGGSAAGGTGTTGTGGTGTGQAGSGGGSTGGSGAAGSGASGGGGSGGGGSGAGGKGPIIGAPTDPGAGPARPKGWRRLPAGPLRGRYGANAVWTGREMITWGGAWRAGNASIWLDDGAAYDPAGDRWRRIAASPLQARAEAFAAWTGRTMLVWGGRPGTKATYGYDDFVDGALYDPAKDTWKPMAAFPLGNRWGTRAVWTGELFVVWGGASADAPDDAPRLSDGAAYNPASNTWKKLPASPLSGRVGPLGASRGGSVLVAWGYGRDNQPEASSAVYDPAVGKWAPAAATPPPGPHGRCIDAAACTGVDTGRRVVFLSDGIAWEPAGDRWVTVAPGPFVDTAVEGEAEAWTGTRIMVYGGGEYGGGDGPEAPPATARAGGAAYDPAADRWEPLSGSPLAARARATAIWTGREFIVWGGEADSSHRAQFDDGAAYTP